MSVVVGFDTATPVTTAALLRPDGSAVEAHDEPRPESRGRHASLLLGLVERVLRDGGVCWEEVSRLAVGVGPGGFTGLRIGIATARALSTAAELPLRRVSSLAALAAGIDGPLRLPLIDARRGELFGALFDGERELWPPFAAAPEEVVARLRQGGFTPLSAGDGSLRFRGMLEEAGISVLAQESEAHVVSALHICHLGLGAEDEPPEAVLPEYLREPDAKPQQ
jgi:tRNA threonylcarbamoyladenosine biosynthesis protein TsaB